MLRMFSQTVTSRNLASLSSNFSRLTKVLPYTPYNLKQSFKWTNWQSDVTLKNFFLKMSCFMSCTKNTKYCNWKSDSPPLLVIFFYSGHFDKHNYSKNVRPTSPIINLEKSSCFHFLCLHFQLFIIFFFIGLVAWLLKFALCLSHWVQNQVRVRFYK